MLDLFLVEGKVFDKYWSAKVAPGKLKEIRMVDVQDGWELYFRCVGSGFLCRCERDVKESCLKEERGWR